MDIVSDFMRWNCPNSVPPGALGKLFPLFVQISRYDPQGAFATPVVSQLCDVPEMSGIGFVMNSLKKRDGAQPDAAATEVGQSRCLEVEHVVIDKRDRFEVGRCSVFFSVVLTKCLESALSKLVRSLQVPRCTVGHQGHKKSNTHVGLRCSSEREMCGLVCERMRVKVTAAE